MQELIAETWQMYERFVHEPFIVKPSIPIMYFGDLERYVQSPIKIITVGLNPSLEEFPGRDGFARFASARDIYPAVTKGQHLDIFLQALNGYFRNDPYTRWFNTAFEKLLNGLDGSYYTSYRNTALHTDICSPLATNPTWSGLAPSERALLEPSGTKLWHQLVKYLRPDVIIMSIAKAHLTKIQFTAIEPWRTLYTINQRDSGIPLRKPYIVQSRLVQIDPHKTTLLVFGQAANTPFGTVSHKDKIEIGRRVKTHIEQVR